MFRPSRVSRVYGVRWRGLSARATAHPVEGRGRSMRRSQELELPFRVEDEHVDSASDVTTRSGRVRPPTRADSDRPRGSRTLAEGFRGRTTSGAEPPPRPGKVGRARGSRGRNRPLESRRTPGPRLPHRYRRRALPGPDARRLLESPPERRGGTWWPCPPGRACSRDSPLPDIGVPAPPMASPRIGGPPTSVDHPLSPAVFRARSSRSRPQGWLGERRVAPTGQGARGPRRRFALRAP